jgi:CubicO group peptidase (beta-lactamase class C family)
MNRFLAIFVCVAFLVALSIGPDTAVQARSTAVPSGAQIDAYLTRAHFHGYMLLVHRGHVLLSKGYAMADARHHVPNTVHTKFIAWNVETSFDAVAIVKLQAQGKLSIRNAVCRYIKHCPTEWRSMTIQHLLTGSSGLPDYNWLGSTGPVRQRLLECTFVSLKSVPGSPSGGSPCESILLSHIVEQVSRRPWAIEIRSDVWGPAGMSETGRMTSKLLPPARAQGYDSGTPDSFDLSHTANYSGFYAAYSTVSDLQKFDMALWNGTLLSHRLLLTMIAARLLDNPGQPGEKVYDAYGWGTVKESRTLYRRAFTGGESLHLSANDEFSPEAKSAVLFYNNDPTVFTGDNEGSFDAFIRRAVFGK